MRLSTFLIPPILAFVTIVAYRPLLSPASDWSLLHSDYHQFHSTACFKQRLSLPCVQWMLDGRAAAEFGVFEPISWLFQSALLTLNNNFLTFHTWHVVSLFLHIITGILLFFTGEQLLAVVDGRDPKNTNGLYRIPMFFATIFWLVHPQRVEAVAWASVYSIPLSSILAILSLNCYLKSTRKEIPWRFLSFILYVFASWTSATVVPLPFVFLLIDLLVVLPAERKRQVAEYKEAAAKKGISTPSSDSSFLAHNLVMDSIRVLFRGFVFVLAHLISYFLANIAALRASLPVDVKVVPSNAQLFLQQFMRYFNPTTIVPRVIRSLVALSWYVKQTFYPNGLHLFQTRHVSFLDESVDHLLAPQNQNEFIDVATIGFFIFFLLACIIAKRQQMFTVCFSAVLFLTAPILGLFTDPATSPTAHIFVADRWIYLASGLFLPYMAWWMIKEETIITESKIEASASSAESTKKSGKETKNNKKSGTTSSSAAAAPTSASISAKLFPRKPKSQPLFFWLAPRLTLTLLLSSIGMNLTYFTPTELVSYKNIIQNCEHILTLDPQVVECREVLGITYFREGNFELAHQHFHDLLDLHSQSLVALVCRGTILSAVKDFPQLSNTTESDRTFQYALEVQPNSPYVLTNWARIQWSNLDRSSEAIRLLEQSISVHPEYPEAYYLLSDIARSLNDTITADAYHSQGERVQQSLGIRPTAEDDSSRAEGLTRVGNDK